MSLLKRADKMIARQVLLTFLIVWAVLVGIHAFTAFANEIDEIGQGNYTLTVALTYVAWTIPRRAYEMFGIAAVIGGVIGLGALAPTSELTALRTAGWSKRRLAWSTLVVIGVLSIPVMWLGETLAPDGEKRAQGVVVGAKSQDLVVTNNTGMWARDGQDLLNAKQGRVLKQGIELIDARLYRFDELGRLLTITRGALATFENGAWQFNDVSRYTFSESAIETTELDRWQWDSQVDPKLLSLSIVDPSYQRLDDLRGHIEYRTRNRLDATTFESAFWARIFFPLSVLAPLLIALPLVFGALRSGGFGKRLFIGLMIAVAYYVVLQPMAINAARVAGVSLILAYTVPPLLLITIGWWRLGRG
jgi:lipopolysaccharide export system permease protein